MNIILTSEMRVGSRWIHYLLKDLLHMKQSPEMDVSSIPDCQQKVDNYFKTGRIVKFHHAKIRDLRKLQGDFKVIGIVRNPRDRITSWAFHQRFKPNSQGIKEIKEAKTEKEAVRAALYLPITHKHNDDQLSLMMRDFSTKQFKRFASSRYIWTSYHWLVNDLFGEIKTICRFLGADRTDSEIKRTCQQHSFKKRSGRESGEEERDNEWFRKGVERDFMNWFDRQMLKYSHLAALQYWDVIKLEEN